MSKLSILFLLCITFISCHKDEPNAPLIMRIQNISGANFSDVNAAGKEFGTVNNGRATGYQSFEKIIEVPSARVTVNGTEVMAGYGYCGSPLPPSLGKGKYTLVISEDPAYPGSHYNARFVKD